MIMDEETWNDEMTNIEHSREVYLSMFPGSPYPITREESFSLGYFIGNAEDQPETYFTNEEVLEFTNKAIHQNKPLELCEDEFGFRTLCVKE